MSIMQPPNALTHVKTVGIRNVAYGIRANSYALGTTKHYLGIARRAIDSFICSDQGAGELARILDGCQEQMPLGRICTLLLEKEAVLDQAIRALPNQLELLPHHVLFLAGLTIFMDVADHPAFEHFSPQMQEFFLNMEDNPDMEVTIAEGNVDDICRCCLRFDQHIYQCSDPIARNVPEEQYRSWYDLNAIRTIGDIVDGEHIENPGTV